jgi:hypothetical protein
VMVRQISDARAAVLPLPPPPIQVQSQTRARAATHAATHVTTAAVAPARQLIEWRRATGAFQFNLVISTKDELLLSEERLLAWLRWMELKMPKTRSWYPVLMRYIDQIAGRVQGFGGDPGKIVPSPTGTVGHPHPGGHEGDHGEHGREERIAYTGKVAALIFDRFGDFEGFALDAEDGERKFFSREPDMKRLVDRAWSERLRITVTVEADDRRRPLSLLVHQPPAPI